jgi:hypothetical protein
MTARLSRVILERLPPDVALSLVELLPDAIALPELEYEELQLAAVIQPDLTIGYPELVEQASRSFRSETLELELEPDFFERLVDFFLWSFAQEFSPELKVRISENLPVDLRTRMNLYSGHAEEAKVG